MDRLRTELYGGTASASIQQLHTVIAHFKTSDGSKTQLPQFNIKAPDVVFVGETPPRWGEMDTQFIQLLKDTGFSSTTCAWTSLIRYNPKDLKSVGAEEVERWQEFLFSELRIWQPKLIVTLGAVTTNTLLGEGPKLAERQNIVHWVGPWAVVPNYSYPYAVNSNRLDSFKQGLELCYKFCFGEL